MTFKTSEDRLRCWRHKSPTSALARSAKRGAPELQSAARRLACVRDVGGRFVGRPVPQLIKNEWRAKEEEPSCCCSSLTLPSLVDSLWLPLGNAALKSAIPPAARLYVTQHLPYPSHTLMKQENSGFSSYKTAGTSTANVSMKTYSSTRPATCYFWSECFERGHALSRAVDRGSGPLSRLGRLILAQVRRGTRLASSHRRAPGKGCSLGPSLSLALSLCCPTEPPDGASPRQVLQLLVIISRVSGETCQLSSSKGCYRPNLSTWFTPSPSLSAAQHTFSLLYVPNLQAQRPDSSKQHPTLPPPPPPHYFFWLHPKPSPPFHVSLLPFSLWGRQAEGEGLPQLGYSCRLARAESQVV